MECKSESALLPHFIELFALSYIFFGIRNAVFHPPLPSPNPLSLCSDLLHMVAECKQRVREMATRACERDAVPRAARARLVNCVRTLTHEAAK